jgi:hypothetical protein
MFLAHGYIVLAPDSRAHGESGGDIATYGLLEWDDAHRWVSWLMEEELGWLPQCPLEVRSGLSEGVCRGQGTPWRSTSSPWNLRDAF